jgi:uncharacterized delta-60 repeat protein
MPGVFAHTCLMSRARRSCAVATIALLRLGLALAVLVPLAAAEARGETLRWTTLVDDHIVGAKVAVAPDGSIYAVGTRYVEGQSDNIWVGKFSPQGLAVWSDTYDGSDHWTDWGGGVAVAPDGSVYAVGSSHETGNTYDIWVRKYTPDGAVVWTRTYDEGNYLQYGNGLAVSPDGSVYVVGITVAVSGDIVILKYSPEGDLLWRRTYDGAAADDDAAYDAAVAGDGSLYVTGAVWAVHNYESLWLGKYSPDGVLLWKRTYPNPSRTPSEGRGLALARNGDVYVAGEVWAPQLGSDNNVLVCKYSPSGALLWTRRYAGPAHGWDMATDVAVRRDGSVFVVGMTELAGYRDRLWLRKYSPGGTPLWTKTFRGQALDTYGSGVAITPLGGICVTGSSYPAGGTAQFLLQEYR